MWLYFQWADFGITNIPQWEFYKFVAADNIGQWV